MTKKELGYFKLKKVLRFLLSVIELAMGIANANGA